MRHEILFCIAASLVGVACNRGGVAAPAPLPRVEVARAVGERVVVPMRFPTLLYSNYDATIQPRVSGYLLSKDFYKGMPVERGQVLFTIDAAPIELSVASARAQLASARAALAEAENNYKRAVPLARIEAISQSSLDQYRAAYLSASAQVELASAQLDEALLQLSYTTITSPIDGIIDDQGATVGDWVGVGTSYSLLATVSNIDEMGVHIPIPYGRYLTSRGGGSDSTPSYDNATLLENIRLYLSDGSLYPHSGTYAYTKREVGNSTGSIIIVASFPNPEGVLKVGQSAVVVADVGSPEGVVLIPQRAVVKMLDRTAVWVVGPDDRVSFRNVKLGNTFGSHWIVENGLKEGERVVTAGIQHLSEGAKVSVDEPSEQDHKGESHTHGVNAERR